MSISQLSQVLAGCQLLTVIHSTYTEHLLFTKGFPDGSVVESICKCRRCWRPGFNPGVGKIPWSRKCQLAPVFLPEKFQGQKSLAGYHPWGHDESDTTERLSTHTLCSRRSARSQDAVTKKEVKPMEKMDWPVIKLP